MVQRKNKMHECFSGRDNSPNLRWIYCTVRTNIYLYAISVYASILNYNKEGL